MLFGIDIVLYFGMFYAIAKSLWKYSENRIACFWLSLGLLKSFFLLISQMTIFEQHPADTAEDLNVYVNIYVKNVNSSISVEQKFCTFKIEIK